jgi:hypothetical protein
MLSPSLSVWRALFSGTCAGSVISTGISAGEQGLRYNLLFMGARPQVQESVLESRVGGDVADLARILGGRGAFSAFLTLLLLSLSPAPAASPLYLTR